MLRLWLHASPSAMQDKTQGKTQAQPGTVNWLAVRRGRRRMEVYQPAEALSDMVWYDLDKWNKSMVTVHGYRLYSSRLKKTKNIREL